MLRPPKKRFRIELFKMDDLVLGPDHFSQCSTWDVVLRLMNEQNSKSGSVYTAEIYLSYMLA